MKIVIASIPLDLPADFNIETSKTNPLFTEVGSQSIPLSLPPSANNLTAMGHPERIDAAQRLPVSVPVDAFYSGTAKRGKLDITSAHERQGVEATIYFDEGEFYSLIKEIKITDIAYPDYAPYTGTTAQRATQMLDHLTQVMRDTITADYMVFPIVVEYETDNGKSAGTILNETEETGDATSEIFMAYKARQKTENGMQVTLPVGYGVTPFIRVHALLRHVFAHFGYVLQNNPFAQDAHLSRLCLLNNTADAIVEGKITYSQLLPDISVNDFFELLFNKFGLVIYVNSNDRTANLYLIRDILQSDPDADLTPTLANIPTIHYGKPQLLNMSAETGIEGALPIADTWEEYRNLYSDLRLYALRSMKESDFAIDPLKPAVIERNFDSPYPVDDQDYAPYIHRLATGEIWRLAQHNVKQIGSAPAVYRHTYVYVRNSSMYFNYRPKNADYEIKSLEAIDEQVPMHCNIFTDFRLTPYYLAGIRHCNSHIVKSTGEEVEEKNDADGKAAFCYGYGYARKQALQSGKQTVYQRERYFYGSTQRYDNNGNAVSYTNGDTNTYVYGLQINELREHFFTEYEGFIRNQVRIDTELLIADYEIDALNLAKPKLIKHQSFLIESIDYQIGAKTPIAKVKAWIKK